MKFTRLIAFWLLIALAAAACGAVSTTPTATPVQLSQTFSSSSEIFGSLEMKYPAGWIGTGDVNFGSALFFSRAELQNAAAVFEAGDAALSLIITPDALLEEQGLGNESPSAALARFGESMNTDGSTTPLEGIEELTINGAPAARAQIKAESGDLLVLVIDVEGAILIFSGATAPGGIARHESTFLAIVESVVYTAP